MWIRVVIVVLVIAAVAFGNGLLASAARPGLSTCAWLGLTYFTKTNDERRRDFAQMSLPRRYVTYICAEQYRHPPALEFATEFASAGAPVVGYLKEKLVETTDDPTIENIVYVFSEMQRIHSYDVAQDADLMSLLRQKTQSMLDSGGQVRAEEDLEDIAGYK
jgi:hypothetical protein